MTHLVQRTTPCFVLPLLKTNHRHQRVVTVEEETKEEEVVKEAEVDEVAEVVVVAEVETPILKDTTFPHLQPMTLINLLLYNLVQNQHSLVII